MLHGISKQPGDGFVRHRVVHPASLAEFIETYDRRVVVGPQLSAATEIAAAVDLPEPLPVEGIKSLERLLRDP